MNKFYVYAHYKTGETNIPFYIGKGFNKRAWSIHNRNRWWKNIVNKHGFDVRLLAEHISEDDAFWLEKQLIGMFGRADLGKGPLVNMTDGGQGATGHSHKHTEEWKKANGERMKGRIPPNKGIKGVVKMPPRTEEWKQKQKIAQTGTKRPPQSAEAREKIRIANLGNKNSLGTKHKPRSAEWKEKQRIAHLGQDHWSGRKHKPESIAKMKETKRLKRLAREALAIQEASERSADTLQTILPSHNV